MKAWTYLLNRSGAEISKPTIDHIKTAVKELYHEETPGMTTADSAEHGDVSLRVGHDDGPMYVLQISRLGIGTWEEWADQDYEAELCPARERELSELLAIKLLSHLIIGNVDQVRVAFADAVEK